MEQCKNMFEKIYAWENLLDAYHHAASEKWFRDDVAAFSAHLGENLTDIQNSLIWKTYTVGRYREFYVYEPKKRLVMALNFRDRVVQWAIYLQLNPLLDNQFIYHSYGCRSTSILDAHGRQKTNSLVLFEARYIKVFLPSGP